MTARARSGGIAEQSVGNFLHELAARVPAPGGGAAAGLHAAQAAALVAMVGRYTTGPKYAGHAALVEHIVSSADDLRQESLELADADVRAFAAVSEAYALPRDDETEKAARSAAIAAALVEAAGPPAAVIRTSAAILDLVEALSPVANRSVITDVAAASESARAAATTARLNVEINLHGIRETSLRSDLEETVAGVADLCDRAAAIDASVRATLR